MTLILSKHRKDSEMIKNGDRIIMMQKHGVKCIQIERSSRRLCKALYLYLGRCLITNHLS